jgi:cell division protein FtsI/penicillin-binding protein 2
MRTMLRRARYRAVFLLVFAVFLFGAVEVRLFVLQVVRGRSTERSSMYKAEPETEHGRRGDILDRRGGVLATSLRTFEVWSYNLENLYPRATAEERAKSGIAIAEELSRITGVDPHAVVEALAGERKWTCLVGSIRNPAVVESLRRLTLEPRFRVLSVEEKFERIYPRGPLFAPVVGWTGWQASRYPTDDPRYDRDGEIRGIFGIELACEKELSAHDGRLLVRRDGRRREMLDPSLDEVAATEGRTVELTLDPLAQEAVERGLDAALEEFNPDWAQAVVIDPRDGDVLAVGQRPTPRSPRPLDPEDAELHKLYCTQVLYPPGSSFKPFMLGLVLEKGLATPATTVDCSNGFAKFGSRQIHDVHPKGVLTAAEVLIHSSNIGMTKLVQKLVATNVKKGDPSFQPVLDHIKNLGFKRRISTLPYEEDGLLPRLRDMSLNQSLASLSFGQEIAVTSLQMATAAAAVANGGTWRPPRFVRAIGDGDGDGDGELVPVPADDARVHPVFSPAIGATLKGLCVRVVEEGGTAKWRPRGWSMGGKTGTAQNEKHHEIPISSYWCFSPVADPRFLVLVVLYHPKKGRFAADNAAKIAGSVMGELLTAYEIPADRPEEILADAAKAAATTHAPAGSRLPGRRSLISSPAVGEGR